MFLLSGLGRTDSPGSIFTPNGRLGAAVPEPDPETGAAGSGGAAAGPAGGLEETGGGLIAAAIGAAPSGGG